MRSKNSVIPQREWTTLGQSLQEAIRQQWVKTQPLQIRCAVREGTLLVLAEHLLHFEPNPDDTFASLEQAIKLMVPEILENEAAELSLPDELTIQLFLRIAGYQQAYAIHTFRFVPNPVIEPIQVEPPQFVEPPQAESPQTVISPQTIISSETEIIPQETVSEPESPTTPTSETSAETQETLTAESNLVEAPEETQAATELTSEVAVEPEVETVDQSFIEPVDRAIETSLEAASIETEFIEGTIFTESDTLPNTEIVESEDTFALELISLEPEISETPETSEISEIPETPEASLETSSVADSWEEVSVVEPISVTEPVFEETISEELVSEGSVSEEPIFENLSEELRNEEPRVEATEIQDPAEVTIAETPEIDSSEPIVEEAITEVTLQEITAQEATIAELTDTDLLEDEVQIDEASQAIGSQPNFEQPAVIEPITEEPITENPITDAATVSYLDTSSDLEETLEEPVSEPISVEPLSLEAAPELATPAENASEIVDFDENLVGTVEASEPDSLVIEQSPISMDAVENAVVEQDIDWQTALTDASDVGTVIESSSDIEPEIFEPEIFEPEAIQLANLEFENVEEQINFDATLSDQSVEITPTHPLDQTEISTVYIEDSQSITSITENNANEYQLTPSEATDLAPSQETLEETSDQYQLLEISDLSQNENEISENEFVDNPESESSEVNWLDRATETNIQDIESDSENDFHYETVDDFSYPSDSNLTISDDLLSISESSVDAGETYSADFLHPLNNTNDESVDDIDEEIDDEHYKNDFKNNAADVIEPVFIADDLDNDFVEVVDTVEDSDFVSESSLTEHLEQAADLPSVDVSSFNVSASTAPANLIENDSIKVDSIKVDSSQDQAQTITPQSASRSSDVATPNLIESSVASPKRTFQWTASNLTLTGAIGAFVLVSGIYLLTRPCVIGECKQLQRAQQLSQEAIGTVQTTNSSLEVVEAYKKLNEANYLLGTIPSWSPHHQAAQALLVRYEDQSVVLSKVVEALEQANTAAQKSQNPPHPLQQWREIQWLWREVIDKLERVPADNSLYPLVQRKLQEYQVNLKDINQRVAIEQQAQDRIDAARQAGQLAETKAGAAKSAENWQEAVTLWTTAIAQLRQIPQGTMAYNESEQLLAIYQPKLTEASTKRMQEQTAAEAYAQALRSAEKARLLEQQSQWSQAVSSWQNALTYAKQIPSGTAYYNQIQPLLDTYAKTLEQAQENSQRLFAIQTVRPSLEQACTGTPKVCSYTLSPQAVRVQFTAAYDRAVQQIITSSQLEGGPSFPAAVINQVNELLRALADVSEATQVPVELYNSSGTKLGTYTPSLSGYVPQ